MTRPRSHIIWASARHGSTAREPKGPYSAALASDLARIRTGALQTVLLGKPELVLDLLTGSLLGLHALSLVIIVYLVMRFRARLRFFPPWQQALAVLALLVNDRIIQLWALLLLGEPMPSWRYWLAPPVLLLRLFFITLPVSSLGA